MRILILAALLQLSLLATFAQNADPDLIKKKPRPKIGLVLSGGGARGFAHIGVLKVLEENRIPVDYISGASMGALVGSLYATGKSPDEMEQLVANFDWDKLLSGNPSYQELSFRRKQDRRNLPGSLSLKGRSVKTLKLPGSLNPGHKIGLAIDNLFLNYSTIQNFDNLPIPFRTVATDMLNAETVVLKSGSLQQSLRATMAIPAVFAPVEINGKILADGGILNNIPTDVVKEMGADIVLVINIETQIGDRSSLDNLIGVLGQTFIVATVENSRRSLREANIIITPNLGDYSSSSFKDGKEIIKLGYEGAKKSVLLIDNLSLTEDEWQEHLAARRSRQIPDKTPLIKSIAVDGSDSLKEREIVKDKLSEKYNDKPLNKSEIENDLTELTGTRRFDSLGYELTGENVDQGLLIRVYDTKERSEGKTNLELGFEVNNAESDTTNFNARGRLTYFDFGGFGAEWRNDFSIGSKTLFATEYYRPIGESGFFIAPNGLYQNRKVGFYQAGNRLAEYSFKTANIGLDLGFAISPLSELRLGYKIGNQTISRRIGDPLLPELSGNYRVTSLVFNFDATDNAQIPTDGLRFSSSLNYYFDAPGVTFGFPQAETKFNAHYPINDRYIAFGFGAGGTSFGRTVPPLQQYSLGGLFNIGGYGSEEFRNSNFLRGGIGILRQTYSLPTFFGGKLYLGGWYEGGTAFEKFDLAPYRQSLTGGVLTETPFGPIFVGGSFTENGRKKLYFSLGRFF